MGAINTSSSLRSVCRFCLLTKSAKTLLLALITASVLCVVLECLSQEIKQDKAEAGAETTSAESSFAKSVGPRFPKESYDFDVDLSEFIGPKQLLEDPLDATIFFVYNVLKLIQKKKYEEATAKAEETLKNLLENDAPWNIQDRPGDKKSVDIMYGEGISVNRAIQLLAFAYEMQGRYRSAWETYSVLYDANPRLLKWTHARIFYESEHYHEAYGWVCNVLRNEYYYVTPESVDRTIEKVRAVEEIFRARKEALNNLYQRPFNKADVEQLLAKNPQYELLLESGIPTGYDKRYNRDMEVLELYRIRNWCVRLMQPDFNYSYGHIDAPQASYEMWDMTAKQRELYAKFVEFMESEHQKELAEHPENRNAAAMNLIRKLLELPY